MEKQLAVFFENITKKQMIILVVVLLVLFIHQLMQKAKWKNKTYQCYADFYEETT